MRSLPIVVSVLALSVGAALPGCKTDSSTGTYNTVTGNLNNTIEADLNRTFEATRAAVRDIGFRETKANKDALQAVVLAKDATDSTIEINLKKLSDRATEVTIDQTVMMGNESKARLLFDKIREHAGAPMR
ncbi:MAG: DUF3568 family protein [Phycisphaerales bacterium]